MKFKDYFRPPREIGDLINRLGDPERFFFHNLPLWFLERMERFARLQVEGLEHIPRHGPALMVGNHSGYSGLDAMLLNFEIISRLHRFPRTMLHSFYFQLDWMGEIAERFAFFRPNIKTGLQHLRKKRLVLVFPEAEEGNFKESVKMYQLQNFHPGYVGMAIMAGVPVIPVAVIGAEETHLNFGRLEFLKPYLGFAPPIPVNLLPLPARWKIIFLKPVKLSRYGKKDLRNGSLVEEINHNIRIRIQARINVELAERGILPF